MPEYLHRATDEELAARARAHLNQLDQEALTLGPIGLARYLADYVRVRPHIKVISDAFNQIQPGDGTRLMILTPPQVGKSQTARWAMLWWLARFPDHRVIIGSYSNDLALKHGEAIRKLVVEFGPRYALYLQRGSAGVTNWTLTSQGGCRSAGVGGGVTGMSADLVLVDDPLKSREEAESRRRRDRIHDWWSADLTSRLAPGAPMVLVNTRWHTDDLAGRLLATEGTVEEGGIWKRIFLPAIAVPPNPDEGVPPDSLGREPGEPLPHPKIAPGDTEALRKHWDTQRRLSSARDWTSLYQCQPKEPRDALVTREVMRAARVNKTPGATRTAVAIDPSGGGRDSAGIMAGHIATDGRLYVTHDRTGVMKTEDWTRKACLLIHEVEADLVIVERNFGGDQARVLLVSRWEAMKASGELPGHAVLPYIDEVVARKNKRIRADPVAQQFILGNIKMLGYHPEVEHEWCTWVSTDDYSPGRVDTLTHMATGLLLPRLQPTGGGQGFAGLDRNATAGASGFPDLPR